MTGWCPVIVATQAMVSADRQSTWRRVELRRILRIVRLVESGGVVRFIASAHFFELMILTRSAAEAPSSERP